MPSWRDQASTQVQDDLDGLLDASLSTAEQALREHGEFSPFAVTVSSDGTASLAEADLPAEHPAADEVIKALVAGLREHREGLRAVAIVSDRVADGSDRVAVQLEHQEGTALQVTLEYRITSGRFTAGALQAGAGTGKVW